jgi:RHS repeat-associated protein
MNGSTLIKAFVNLPGGATAVYNSSGLAYYRHSDHLGSSRLASTPARGLYSSTAYTPFGEPYATAGTTDASFTGQNQDTVPSLYDFTFRKHSHSQGRWISPDPLGVGAVDPTNPQTWNRYAYVANNPLSAVDPTGLNEDFCGAEYDNCSGGIGEVGGGIGGGGGGGGGGFGGGGGPGVGFGGSGTSGLQNGLNQYLSYIPPFGDGWAPCTTPGSDCWYNTTTDANWYPGEYTSSSVFSDPTILTGTGGGIGGAGGETGGCTGKILSAVNNQFGTSFTSANVGTGPVYGPFPWPQVPGGTVNIDIFPQGQAGGISPGRYPVNWWTYVIGYGSTLHIPAGPGGMDSPSTLLFSASQFTAHLDSAFPYNPIGAVVHGVKDVLGIGGHSPCP